MSNSHCYSHTCKDKSGLWGKQELCSHRTKLWPSNYFLHFLSGDSPAISYAALQITKCFKLNYYQGKFFHHVPVRPTRCLLLVLTTYLSFSDKFCCRRLSSYNEVEPGKKPEKQRILDVVSLKTGLYWETSL